MKSIVLAITMLTMFFLGLFSAAAFALLNQSELDRWQCAMGTSDSAACKIEQIHSTITQ